jgi:hypothetical protein
MWTQDHYWNNTGWFNWNFYNNTNIGPSGSPPPGNLFKLRFVRSGSVITCGWQINGTTWVEPHTISGLNVINLFVYVQNSESIDVQYLKLT